MNEMFAKIQGWYEFVPMIEDGLQDQLYTSMSIRPHWKTVPKELRELVLEAASIVDGPADQDSPVFRSRKIA